jgi:hypothetical protein
MAKKQHLGIKIDLSKDEVLSDQALKLLVDYYCRKMNPHHNMHLQGQQSHTPTET